MNYTPQITTVEKFAKLLNTESKGNPVIAMRIVDQSIEKGWKALYPLKNKQIDQATYDKTRAALEKCESSPHFFLSKNLGVSWLLLRKKGVVSL